MTRFRLGLDYDGTVTRHPDHLRFLADHILMSGGEVYIISGRRQAKDRAETLARLKEIRFRFTELVLYPGDYSWTGARLDGETLQDIGKWKAMICEDFGINLFMDDGLHSYSAIFTCPTVHV